MSKIVEIQISQYDENWPQIFLAAKDVIESCLGSNCLQVHHVGSTAVEGLCAKPRIDIIAVVKDCSSSIEPLEKVGFTYKGEWNIPFKFGFTWRDQHQINLHVLSENHPEIQVSLIFRDHLRKNPESKNQYAQIKQQLLKQESSFEILERNIFSGYTMGKADFINSILKKEGFCGERFLKPSSNFEQKEYGRIYQEQICLSQSFDTSNFNWSDHPANQDGKQAFILCSGLQVAAIALVQMQEQRDKAQLLFVASDSTFAKQGFEEKIRTLSEEWLEARKNSALLN